MVGILSRLKYTLDLSLVRRRYSLFRKIFTLLRLVLLWLYYIFLRMYVINIRPYPWGLLHWHWGNLGASEVTVKGAGNIDLNLTTKLMAQTAVLKISAIRHARNLRKLARSYKELRLMCPPDPQNLPGTALFSGNPPSKTVLSKCSFIWNKGPVNIWNTRKAHKYNL